MNYYNQLKKEQQEHLENREAAISSLIRNCNEFIEKNKTVILEGLADKFRAGNYRVIEVKYPEFFVSLSLDVKDLAYVYLMKSLIRMIENEGFTVFYTSNPYTFHISL